ncbi:MAG TPA: SPFH domain-containing protein, partial [Ktedonobacteraceae bacterium]|nr:SPFH domain-containing protein [Ktedonobacteraceae bacterium]
MSSEQGDSNAIWGEGPQEREKDQQPPVSSSTSAAPDNQGLVIPPNEHDEVEPPQDANSSGKGRFSQIVRRFSPVLVPLPFAILIFLFTLPFTLKGQSYLPPLPLAVLLIALVIMQGTLLYYAGSNDTYWTLFVIIGYALFLVVGTLAIFGFVASLILLIILLIIGAILARRAIIQVPEGYVDMVMMSGKYARTLYPGPNFKMPLEKVGKRLNTKEITWTCPEQVVKISRDEDVKLIASISYKLLPEDAHLAALQVDNWEAALQKLFVSTLQSVINELSPTDFMNVPQGSHSRTLADINSIDAATITRWDRVNTILAKRVQDQVEKWGVLINYVRIQDVTLIPHLTPSVNPPWRQAPVDVG